jgi:hypothetical protein
MKKLVLSLCVLSLVAFGLAACSDASADSSSSSIETDVVALQAQVTALESASAAQQTAIDTLQATVDTLQSANVPKVYDNNDILLGRAVGAGTYEFSTLTSTEKLFTIWWDGTGSDTYIAFTTSDCTGTPVIVDDYPSNVIIHWNGGYYVKDVSTPAASVTTLSYNYPGLGCQSSATTQTVYRTVSITPAQAGLPATIAYPLIIKN